MTQGAKPFWFALLALTILATIALGGWGRDAYQLWNNQWNHPALDRAMSGITHLGDGLIFLPIFAFCLLFLPLRQTVGLAVTGTATLTVTHVLKEVVFHGAPRPASVFEHLEGIHYVPGIDIHLINSFPSGHTTAAFAAYGFLAFALRSRPWSILMGLLALGVGYSRIYLMQHFLTDVLAGAWLGTLCALLGTWVAQSIGGSRGQIILLRTPWFS
jgi:membrane-associated phospholipid phosphatase